MDRALRTREPIGGLRTRIVTAAATDRSGHRHERIVHANTTADHADPEPLRSHEL
jgi:hypothetical protein